MDHTELKKHFEALRSGSREAFAAIYHDMKTPVFTVICRIVRDRTLAEDVMQEVFLKLYRSPPGSEVKNCRAWVFTVAHNLSLDALRKIRDTELTEGDIAPSPEESVISSLDAERAMASLSPDERSAVTLHLNADLRFREIAAIMGLSPAAAYRLYSKGIKKLRTAMEGELQ